MNVFFCKVSEKTKKRKAIDIPKGVKVPGEFTSVTRTCYLWTQFFAPHLTVELTLQGCNMFLSRADKHTSTAIFDWCLGLRLGTAVISTKQRLKIPISHRPFIDTLTTLHQNAADC